MSVTSLGRPPHQRAPRDRDSAKRRKASVASAFRRAGIPSRSVDHQAGHQQPQLAERGQAELVQAARLERAARHDLAHARAQPARLRLGGAQRLLGVDGVVQALARVGQLARVLARELLGRRRSRWPRAAPGRSPPGRRGSAAAALTLGGAAGRAAGQLDQRCARRIPTRPCPRRAARGPTRCPRCPCAPTATSPTKALRNSAAVIDDALRASGRVVEVGVRALHQLGVLLVQRQPPAELAGVGARRRRPRRTSRRRWRTGRRGWSPAPR